MKTSIISAATTCAFICSYFLGLALDNAEQFLAVACVVLLDGFFGIIAGIKREGFKTYKAIKVLRTLVLWWVILGVILAVEKGFVGTGWLSETVVVPFLIFQLISALKNASLSGWIQLDVLSKILEKIDQHKETKK
jgi:phage-related holin|tara:strand:+ start:42 stop:449 length:408 start_codon:yes stop_codon:yes gene_type:complete